MFLRLVKSLVSQDRALESAKEALAQNRTFSLEESFMVFDKDEDG